ncbi:hypothetical protein [Amycolatopsis suaedae]|uniref:Uncharacterized protein n=1 Tax=Amycolatopsis suaedae TaxID=2510978 RepID=A0A4V2EL22_9PSEU|nr:hypothetical protein [Amycolatopsis suaedae]RZQ60055.1 hypothetical protein EWH70_30580 [Amycolatopsis suaedae]
MNTPSAHSLGTGDPARQAVLRAATAPLDKAFDDRVRVEVEQLNRVGSWVFLQATMRDAGGGRPYYAGTGYEARRADGVMSDTYVALLRKSDDDTRPWRLSDYVIGPTDVAWLTWPDKHEAPRELFGF